MRFLKISLRALYAVVVPASVGILLLVMRVMEGNVFFHAQVRGVPDVILAWNVSLWIWRFVLGAICLSCLWRFCRWALSFDHECSSPSTKRDYFCMYHRSMVLLFGVVLVLVGAMCAFWSQQTLAWPVVVLEYWIRDLSCVGIGYLGLVLLAERMFLRRGAKLPGVRAGCDGEGRPR